eukprot:Em0016g909a
MTSETDSSASEIFDDTENARVDKYTAFRDMEQELEALMTKYLIPPNDLNKLLEIVMSLSETIDKGSKELDELNLQKKELEEMWLAEKNKWRLSEKSKLELECEQDIERAQFISERRSLEGQKANLEAKLKQAKQQNLEVESQLLQLKDKIADDERIRRNFPPAELHHPEVKETQVKEVLVQDNIDNNTETLPAPSSTEDGRGLGWQDENFSDMERQNAHLYIQPTPENLDGINLYEELMSAMDPVSLGASKADLQMLLKEKEQWDKEKAELLRERQLFREEKEAKESENTRLRSEIDSLQQTEKSLNQKLLEVRKEADTVLSAYFNQPYKDFCVTQLELLNVLKMHQSAKIQLESEREEKRRFRAKIRTALSKEKSLPNEDAANDSERPNEMLVGPDLPSLTSRATLSRPSIAQGQLGPSGYTALNEWIAAKPSFVPSNTLPVWMGHIPLSGIGIQRIDCTAVGRIAKSFSTDTPIQSSLKGNAAGIQHKSHAATPGCDGAVDDTSYLWKAEVWVATSDEYSAYIEIVDVLGKTAKVRQRFLVKPSTQKVQCMGTVPGHVEPSQEYINFQSLDLSWVEETYSSKSQLHHGLPDDDCDARFSKSEESILSTGGKSKAGSRVHDTENESAMKIASAGTPPTSNKASRRVCIKKKTGIRRKPTDSTMWLITTDGRLCFYPTSNPSHVLINSIQLCRKALCFLYVQGKVLVGHTGGLVTVFCKLTGTWILDRHKEIHLPPSTSLSTSTSSTSTNTDCSDDVRCMAEAGYLAWIGCGASIYFVDVSTLEVKGSTTLSDGILDKIVVSGGIAIATTLNGSTLLLYDVESTKLLSTLCLTPLASLIGIPPDQLQISTIVADEQATYVGTSVGKVAVIPATRALGHSENEADLDWCTVSVQGHLGAVCLQHMALPAGCSISGKPALGQGHHHAVSSNTAHGATLIVSAGMGHCTAEVDQCTLQSCDEGYCVMVWSVQSQ